MLRAVQTPCRGAPPAGAANAIVATGGVVESGAPPIRPCSLASETRCLSGGGSDLTVGEESLRWHGQAVASRSSPRGIQRGVELGADLPGLDEVVIRAAKEHLDLEVSQGSDLGAQRKPRAR